MKQGSRIVDLWMPLKIQYDHIPGVSIAVAHKGKIVYAKGFGFADVEKNHKADMHMAYHIASMSKTFTAVAIMKLVEDGKLRLEDKIVDYIPWFKAKTKRADAANITVRQVLSHASGVFRDGNDSQWETGKFPKELSKSFVPESLIVENNTKFKYTNYGYSLLGIVVEKASGVKYGEYLIKNIFKPLGLTDTRPDYEDNLKNAATGYGRVIPDEKRKIFPHYKANAYAPATGFVSTAVDMAKFISSLSLNEKRGVLGREAKKEMSRAHEKTGDEGEYGLGLDIDWQNGSKIIGHGGNYSGFTGRTLLDTTNDVSIVVLTNTMGAPATPIAFGILDAIRRLANPDKDLSGTKKVNGGAYEGLYRSVWGDDVVAQAGNALVAFSPQTNSPLGRKATVFVPTGKKNEFIMRDKSLYSSYDEPAWFEGFKNGKATILMEAGSPLKRVKSQ